MKNYGAVEEGVPSEFANCFTFSVKIISRFKTRLKHAYPCVNVSTEFLNLHVSHAAGVVVVVVVVGGRGWGRGFTLFYKPDRYVPPPPPKGMVLGPFWSEKVYRLCPFGLKSGMVFEGTAGANEHIYRFSSK